MKSRKVSGSTVLKRAKFFFLGPKQTTYPLHTTTYARLCKSSLNSTKRLRVVHRMGTKTISPSHHTDPGTVDERPLRRRRPRPIGESPPWDPSTREAPNDTKIDFLDTPPNDPTQTEIQYSFNRDTIVTDQGRNGRSSANVVFHLPRSHRTTSDLLRARAPGDPAVSII